MPKLCVRCHVNNATVPDRENIGRPIKKLCIECHADDLKSDMQTIIALHKKTK
jgi:hypothetical protein